MNLILTVGILHWSYVQIQKQETNCIDTCRIEPRYQEMASRNIAEATEDGVIVRIIAGELGDEYTHEF
ncbi:unnamed protein product [Lactuca virosa]|uniref:Uncharacterized protein n=1 Tax=Lactuca virosa TaxID=75947 RepID=A0AAU9M5L4_9ASTR|nr:unnamed protein product [Lactuca virosa]